MNPEWILFAEVRHLDLVQELPAINLVIDAEVSRLMKRIIGTCPPR